MIAQLLVSKKRSVHILFAIFCGSVAFSAVKKITDQSIGDYQYLVGIAACATCNVYWLFSRALFRQGQAFGVHHLAFAISLAMLIMFKQGYLFANSQLMFSQSSSSFVNGILSELIVMLSSCVLIASIWEGLRAFNTLNKLQKAQRIVYVSAFFMAVAICKTVQVIYASDTHVIENTLALVTLFMLCTTQALLLWCQAPQPPSSVNTAHPSNRQLGDIALANKIRALLIEQQGFLTSNLKVADLAGALQVSEYKISRALRYDLQAKNFNSYVNALRIEHAKSILSDPDKEKWSVLVVGLESGFASLGPFTRAFKSTTGLTPNQYRQTHCT
ncbi:helix-turn-helix transcriptional regulator [Agaribacter flavus]|uniref:Helix-turn-helix transcriptional regulator n=1 Tax=Agaribacter flavus TaxID=1902781 RepID=A0ABV7FQZ4_9ALTE